MSNIIDSIQLSGVTYTIQGSGGGVPESTFTAYTATTDERISQDEEVTAAGLNALNSKITPTVELTQAQYDALVTAGTVAQDTYYIITDAQAGDLTNYYTKSETNTLLDGKQATLVSGTNIKTINNESILGSGNLDIQGGGKAVTGGTNISVTTGETADTINCTIPYTDTASRGFDIGTNFDARYNLNGRLFIGNYILGNGSMGLQGNSVGVCYGTSSNKSKIYGKNLVGIGYEVTLGTDVYNGVNDSVAIGHLATAKISNAVAIGSSAVASGTTKTNINNQLKIDTSNQIYIMDKTNTNEICLQDQLGGSSITVDTALDSGSTNPVENRVIYNKIDEVEQVTAAGLNVLNDKFGGMKLVKLTQTEYNNLQTKDNNTLYVIVN